MHYLLVNNGLVRMHTVLEIIAIIVTVFSLLGTNAYFITYLDTPCLQIATKLRILVNSYMAYVAMIKLRTNSALS